MVALCITSSSGVERNWPNLQLLLSEWLLGKHIWTCVVDKSSLDSDHDTLVCGALLEVGSEIFHVAACVDQRFTWRANFLTFLKLRKEKRVSPGKVCLTHAIGKHVEKGFWSWVAIVCSFKWIDCCVMYYFACGRAKQRIFTSIPWWSLYVVHCEIWNNYESNSRKQTCTNIDPSLSINDFFCVCVLCNLWAHFRFLWRINAT